MAATEQVILVDENDHPTGAAEKLEAHRKALCHRAFSVFVCREGLEREILLQQRGKNKYHSPGLWTNTCCSHPRPGEEVIAAGERRLREEMGLALSLTDIGWFHYIAEFSNGLTENEVDHVLVGVLKDQAILPDPEEVQAYRWVTVSQLKQELLSQPEEFTPWLRQALEIYQGQMVGTRRVPTLHFK